MDLGFRVEGLGFRVQNSSICVSFFLCGVGGGRVGM